MNPELSYASHSDEAHPEPPPQSFLNRLMGVYFSPSETFQEIGRSPRVVVPILAYLLFTIATVAAFTTRIPMDRLANQRIDAAVESGRMTPEAAEKQKEQTQKILPYLKFATPFLAGIWSVIVLLVIAGVAKLASMLMGAENGFKALFSVSIYATLAVSIIGGVLFLILLFIKPVDDFDVDNPLGSNLAALLTMANVGLSKFMKVFLSYVDVFYIWKIILLGLGFAAASRKLKPSTALIGSGVIAFLLALVHASWAALFS
ncbi:MAG TPA: YIP1 family protein [Blastocatellia bacterium]|nr:YIP1 family protein [Blastocatellia bacterium]